MKYNYNIPDKLGVHGHKERFQKKPFYCPFPFKYVYGEQDGAWALCSEAINSDHNSSDMSIIEWFTSDYMNKVRKEMLSDTPSMKNLSMCSNCIESEKNHGHSTRTNLDSDDGTVVNTFWFERLGEYMFVGNPITIQIRMFKNNETCNLSCYMCFPKFSSKRRVDTKKINVIELIPRFEYVDTSGPKSRKISALEDIKEVAPYLHNIEIIGGEPLYIKESYDFISRLVKEVDCSNINLSIFTNLSVLENDGRNFLDFKKYFQSMLFKVSLDGVVRYNDYIRYGSSFETLSENIKSIKRAENCKILIWTTLSMLSILRYDLLREWLDENDLLDYHEYNFLRDPYELSVANLPDQIKKSMIHKFTDHPQIIKLLKSEGSDEMFQTAMKYVTRLDKLHGTDVFELYPELKEYVK